MQLWWLACSGKTVEEVWQAIQAGKGSNGAFESVTLGSFLQSVGLDMPPTLSSDQHMANLQLPAQQIKVPPVGPPGTQDRSCCWTGDDNAYSSQRVQQVEPLMTGMPHLSHPIPHHSTAEPSNDLRLEDLGRPALVSPNRISLYGIRSAVEARGPV